MILSTRLIALALAMAPSLVLAGMFPKDSLVKILDHKSFKKAMKANETSLVAFVAPWCGHCQKMAPEYTKAALGLHPLVPVYAVNCDAEKNKRLCSEQGVQGFPTVKLFPRGNSMPPVLYTAERTATGFWYFVTRGIPNAVEKLYYVDQIPGWVSTKKHKHRALLLTQDKKVPLLWRVLANKYSGTDILFATHRDRKGKSSVELGFEAGGKKEAKVLLYPVGSTTPVRYHGVNKQDSLSKFFDSVLDGTADLTEIVEKTKEEKYVEDPEEAEIARKQEAQRIALLHGGFTDLIDFEKAMLAGGADYHDTNGYGGMMGGVPETFTKEKASKTPDVSAASATATPMPYVSNTPDSVSATPQPTKAVVVDQVVLDPEIAVAAAAAGQCAPPNEPVGESDCQSPDDAPKEAPQPTKAIVADQVVLEAPEAAKAAGGCQCASGCQCGKACQCGQRCRCASASESASEKDQIDCHSPSDTSRPKDEL